MGRRLRGVITSAALVGVLLAGCGDGDESEAAATSDGSVDGPVGSEPQGAPETGDDGGSTAWCPVTTEQVSGVVRHDVVEGQPCSWSAPDLTGAVLEVYLSGTDAQHLAGSTEAVAGVGDAAAFDVVDALVFERNDAYWVVQILNIGGASDVVSRDAEIELAKLAVEGLG